MRYFLIFALTITLAACTPPQKPVEVQEVPSDIDMDGVFDTADLCPDTPMGQMVDATGCAVDSDNDGVLNTDDLCPDTAPGVLVGATGCASKISLQLSQGSEMDKIDIEFAPGSIMIPLSNHEKIEKVAKSIEKNSTMTVAIEGCEDSAGNDPSNIELYWRRANAIRNLLINYGLDAHSIPDIAECSRSPASKKALR